MITTGWATGCSADLLAAASAVFLLEFLEFLAEEDVSVSTAIV